MNKFFFRIKVALIFFALVIAGVNLVNHYKDKTPPVESEFSSSLEFEIVIGSDEMSNYLESVGTPNDNVIVTAMPNEDAIEITIEFKDPPVLYPQSWIQDDGSCPKCVEYEAKQKKERKN